MHHEELLHHDTSITSQGLSVEESERRWPQDRLRQGGGAGAQQRVAAAGRAQTNSTEDEGAEDIQQELDWDFKKIEAEEDDAEEALLHTTRH